MASSKKYDNPLSPRDQDSPLTAWFREELALAARDVAHQIEFETGQPPVLFDGWNPCKENGRPAFFKWELKRRDRPKYAPATWGPYRQGAKGRWFFGNTEVSDQIQCWHPRGTPHTLEELLSIPGIKLEDEGIEHQTCMMCRRSLPVFRNFSRCKGVYKRRCFACNAALEADALWHEVHARREERRREKAEAPKEHDRELKRKLRKKKAYRDKERAYKEGLKRKFSPLNEREYLARKRAELEAWEQERKRVVQEAPMINRQPPTNVAQANRLYKELAERVLAQREMLVYVKRMHPEYMAGWIHKMICQHLVWFSHKVVAVESPRLQLRMPPRHGKSHLASGDWPSWHLGNWPHHEWIGASYSASLAVEFSRKVRGFLEDKEFQNVFEACRVDPENRNAEGWKTTKRGGYQPAGIGGPITGKGAHVLSIDDPVKNAEEAQSEISRQAVWDWYGSTAYTRLAPGGGVCLTMTRWHDDDLAGRLEAAMEKGEGDWFVVLDFPAIAVEDERFRKKGEALHPERYDLKALNRIKRTVDPWVWNSLYQQKPVPDDGEFFSRDMFRYYDPKDIQPEALNKYSAWDLAVGQKQRNDWTVGLTAGLNERGDVFLLDRLRFRAKSDKILAAILDNHVKWQTQLDGIEKSHIEEALGPFMEQEVNTRGIHTFVPWPLKVGRRDKELRARPIQGMCRVGRVYLPKDAPWLDEFVHELLRFPAGTKDDQVDAFAWLGQMVGEVGTPGDQHQSEQRPKTGWRDKMRRRSMPAKSYMQS